MNDRPGGYGNGPHGNSNRGGNQHGNPNNHNNQSRPPRGGHHQGGFRDGDQGGYRDGNQHGGNRGGFGGGYQNSGNFQGGGGQGGNRPGPRGNRFAGGPRQGGGFRQGRAGPPGGPRGGSRGGNGGGYGGGAGFGNSFGPGRGPARDQRDDRAERPQPIEILHLEEHFVVVKKPVNVVTAAIRSRSATALDMTREELKRRRERNLRVFPVHEIDRDASGVLVFARTDEATHELRRQFRSRGTDRIYLALIEADLAPDTAPTTIRTRMIENARGVGQSIDDHEAMPTGPDKPRATVTHVRPVVSRDGLSLVRLRAETDHPFQLRAHMAEAGTPIAGDRAYRTRRQDIPRLALHLGEVTFSHPITGERTRQSSPAPAPFYELVGKTPPRGSAPSKTIDAEGNSRPTHWDPVSEWYDDLIGGRGNDLYELILVPRTLGLLGDTSGRTIVDIACGQGVLSRALAERGARVVGVDAAPGLIERARELGGHAESGSNAGRDSIEYYEGDAQALGAAIPATEGGARTFDDAVCLMALMNIEDLDAAVRSAANAVRPGGSFVGVILHPAFRSPRQTAWGWIGSDPKMQKQFRRVDSYMSENAVEITMNPGAAASGGIPVTTTTFHRPISQYVRALAEAGFAIDRLEEWTSPRASADGPRAAEENRARNEFPMFLAFRAVRTDSAPSPEPVADLSEAGNDSPGLETTRETGDTVLEECGVDDARVSIEDHAD